MNEVQYEKIQADAAYGQWLLTAIANHVGANEPTEKSISHRVYKDTACGAWVKFTATGIQVGTIVEGSDAEFAQDIDLEGIDFTEEGEAELVARFDTALQNCEDFSDEHFQGDEEEN